MPKRLIDVLIAAPALVLAGPVILIAAFAIRFTSPGNAIYVQSRVGHRQTPFRCYKLRTMVAHAPSVPTHEAAASLITPVGRALRRFKFDELPQLWNVLKGEMSLVGPRPCLTTQHELIECRARLGVFAARPGVTGLAQVGGIDMSNPERCAQADAEYLRRQSTGLDLLILVRTFGIRGGRSITPG